MSVKTLENSIVRELRTVAKNDKIKLKDLMEWSTGKIKAQDGETLFFLPVLKVHCAVKLP